MIERDLKDIVEADLLKLIADPVREGRTIEYKSELNLKTDDAKRKFLATIASFANAAGGDLVLGMKTDSSDKALPVALQPLVGFKPDADVLMLQEIVRRHIEPKVFTADYHSVELNAGGYALVVRIRKTWAGAHMVTYNDDFRFYTRHQGGRSPMNVPEIRAAFTLAETTMEKINRFRLERLGNILAGEIPVTLGDKGIIVLHLCPLRSFEPAYKVNLVPLRKTPYALPLLYINATSHGDDFDGYLAAHRPDGVSSGFTYAYKTGCLESVDTGILQPGRDELHIPSGLFDVKLIEQTKALFTTLKTIGAEPPVVLMLSILHAKGYSFLLGPRYDYRDAKPINRDQLLLPAVMVENFELTFADSATLLRPLLDSIWNACGYERSLNFDGKGKWEPMQ